MNTIADFSNNADAQKLRIVMRALQGGARPARGLNEEMDRLSGCVTRAIREGRVGMSFVPAVDGSVTLPVTDHALYLQAVMYWCARLDAPIPRVIEACGRSGDAASVARVKRTLKQIALDDRLVRTTTFFAAEPQR